jgi:hypothetical protein
VKQEKNEKVEVYYERLLKLTNNLQHKTTDSFMSLDLDYNIFVWKNNKHEDKNLAVAQGNSFGL